MSDFTLTLSADLELVNRILAQSAAKSFLDRCSFQTSESRYGAGDSLPCSQLATVHVLATEQEFCETHFRKGER